MLLLWLLLLAAGSGSSSCDLAAARVKVFSNLDCIALMLLPSCCSRLSSLQVWFAQDISHSLADKLKVSQKDACAHTASHACNTAVQLLQSPNPKVLLLIMCTCTENFTTGCSGVDEFVQSLLLPFMPQHRFRRQYQHHLATHCTKTNCSHFKQGAAVMHCDLCLHRPAGNRVCTQDLLP